jgi:nitrate reductase alpha subunit
VARRGARGQARPAHDDRLPDDSSTLFSDVVLPAATWYEKHDLNTTDMHPFVHSFNPAIAPPWQTKTDWDAWKAIASVLRAGGRPPRHPQRDVVAKPLWHDTPEAMATVHGVVKDWRTGEVEPVPGQDPAGARRRRARLHRRSTTR